MVSCSAAFIRAISTHLAGGSNCLLLSAYCLLPTAYCLLLSAYCLLPSAYCLLPSAFCLQLTPAQRAIPTGAGAQHEFVLTAADTAASKAAVAMDSSASLSPHSHAAVSGRLSFRTTNTSHSLPSG